MPPDIKPSSDDSKPTQTTNSMSDNAKPSAKICLACGTAGVKNRCGGCRQVYFCNLDCQKRIWTAHRPICQQLVATKPDEKTNKTNKTNSTADVASPTPDAINIEVANKPTSAAPTTIAPTPTEPSPVDPTSAANMTALPTKRQASPRKKSVVILTTPTELALSENTEQTTAKTPRKHKKKKKKARSNSLHAPASASMTTVKNRSQSLSVKKHIMWGAVHVREFTRFPGGGSAVPYDGSWALGLGSPVADVQLGSVLEIEELRLQDLEARAKDLTKSKRSHVSEGETRQFDYKNGIRNPLFGRLTERERKKLFSEAEVKHMHEQEENHIHSVHKSQRKRSMSSELASNLTNFHALEENAPDFACVSSEQLNEFAVIRDSRDDSCGCSCGDLVKKVMKMNQKKIVGFLAARGVRLGPQATKMELLARAKVMAMEEKNCSNSVECECTKYGVSCHANVCVGCAGDCWNPHKQYAYEKERVKEYRREQLAKWKQATTHHQSISVA